MKETGRWANPKKDKKPFKKDVGHEEVSQAIKEYLKKGGKIKKIEPLFIEEGNFFK